MRLKKIDVDPRPMRLNIDMIGNKEPFAVVMCDGQARMTELPEHGETAIVPGQGEVKRVKWDEGRVLNNYLPIKLVDSGGFYIGIYFFDSYSIWR
ncbi:XtrA/YqaO family protein [Sporolactobacillus pectinivorans]|uniref:XtrA/YqaO family protein n=1 Tax=Sporolactobacillus pectinivorans TaxID=1591408 RepID=UPI00138FFE6C